jgi:hypothetical protein
MAGYRRVWESHVLQLYHKDGVYGRKTPSSTSKALEVVWMEVQQEEKS